MTIQQGERFLKIGFRPRSARWHNYASHGRQGAGPSRGFRDTPKGITNMLKKIAAMLVAAAMFAVPAGMQYEAKAAESTVAADNVQAKKPKAKRKAKMKRKAKRKMKRKAKPKAKRKMKRKAKRKMKRAPKAKAKPKM
jgi:hypothetical protein